METFKRGYQKIKKIRENENLKTLFMVLGLGILVFSVWVTLPAILANFLKGVGLVLLLLGSDLEGDRKKRKTNKKTVDPEKLFQDYLKKHPDLCKFINECETYANPKCHKRTHKKCEIFLVKEWR